MKDKILKEIDNMIQVIDDNEVLFHDGIDEEITALLIKIFNYIVTKGN